MTDVERQLAALYGEVPEVSCRGLCTDSCGSVAMAPLEQRRIAGKGRVLLPLLGAFEESCPALQDGRCEVYEVRPMVCRLYGAVEGMRCPYGCEPEGGHLPDREGQRLLARVSVLSRRSEVRR